MQFKVTKQRMLHRLSALNFTHLPCTQFKNRIKLKETERDSDKQRARAHGFRSKNKKKNRFPVPFKNSLFPVTLKRSFCSLIFPEKEAEEEGR